jgi:hypothetical protein
MESTGKAGLITTNLTEREAGILETEMSAVELSVRMWKLRKLKKERSIK